MLQKVGGLSLETIQRAVVDDTLDADSTLAQLGTTTTKPIQVATTERKKIFLPQLDITVLGTPDASRTNPIEKVVVVGAGILGCSTVSL